MILGYLRLSYDKEPALINGLLASLVGIVANQVFGLNVPTDQLAVYVAVVLTAALGTRRKVTAPATLYPTDAVDEKG